MLNSYIGFAAKLPCKTWNRKSRTSNPVAMFNQEFAAQCFSLKNGSSLRLRVNQGNVIYREPFTDVQYFGKGATNNIYIEVPAIRPSFVESLPAYRR